MFSGPFAGQQLGGVLVDEEVAALDGVEHVQVPGVLGGVAERGGDAALGGAGVRAERMHLGEDRNIQRGVFADLQRGPHSCEARAHDQYVMLQHQNPPAARSSARSCLIVALFGSAW